MVREIEVLTDAEVTSPGRPAHAGALGLAGRRRGGPPVKLRGRKRRRHTFVICLGNAMSACGRGNVFAESPACGW